MAHPISALQDKVNAALLTGDWPTLYELIAPDARIIGPKGFMTDRDEWIRVHRETGYELVRLEPFETEVHDYGSAGVRIDSVESECSYHGETISGRFRVTQSWVTDHGRWQLAAIQYTALSA
jgi:Domain of unknown function (DUF4440)